MNENIDLTKILKNCPKGTTLYSTMLGIVFFNDIIDFDLPKIEVKDSKGKYWYFSSHGRLIIHEPREDWEGGDYNMMSPECLLFASKEQRDWSKFTAPWYKKEKFDPKKLEPFDRVLIRNSRQYSWRCSLYSHINKNTSEIKYVVGDNTYKYCIPYNDDTKHLVGTKDEAPEYYRHWED